VADSRTLHNEVRTVLYRLFTELIPSIICVSSAETVATLLERVDLPDELRFALSNCPRLSYDEANDPAVVHHILRQRRRQSVWASWSALVAPNNTLSKLIAIETAATREILKSRIYAPPRSDAESTLLEEFRLPYPIGALLPSADSTRLACIAGNSSGMHVEVNGQVVGNRSYDEVAGLTFSSDSKHVAFAARGGRTWIVVFDGQEGPGWDGIGQTSPIIAPDCTSCVYAAIRNGKWHVVFGETEHGSYEDFGPGGIAVSPDSTRCAYVIKKQGCVADDDRWSRRPFF
jgi:hypothetical protein